MTTIWKALLALSFTESATSTHHHACACREDYFFRLEKALEIALRGLERLRVGSADIDCTEDAKETLAAARALVASNASAQHPSS